MALPLMYNVESVRTRWRTTVVAVLGIAGSVGVFVAMLALAHGFEATLVTSGSPDNVMVRRVGATSELDSVVTGDQVHALEDVPEIARGEDGPLVSPEIVVIASLPLKATGTDANVQIRGVTQRALQVHRHVKIVEGRFFAPSVDEVVVGKHAAQSYAGIGVGRTLKLGGSEWTIVGVMDTDGSSFDSEIWCDGTRLAPVYDRPLNIFGSATARLTSESALTSLRDRVSGLDPRLRVQVERETDYYKKASELMQTVILRLGSLVAGIMGLGAVFAALNTMHSAVAERAREIATIRALGFGAGAVVTSFVLEALLIAAVGGVVGCLAALPLNGFTTSTMNFATFSHLAFAFRITPQLLLFGMGFALFMGLLGGFPPALRASRLPITVALRDL
jgi:putative ABC transport system permease protein